MRQAESARCSGKGAFRSGQSEDCGNQQWRVTEIGKGSQGDAVPHHSECHLGVFAAVHLQHRSTATVPDEHLKPIKNLRWLQPVAHLPRSPGIQLRRNRFFDPIDQHLFPPAVYLYRIRRSRPDNRRTACLFRCSFVHFLLTLRLLLNLCGWLFLLIFLLKRPPPPN